MRFVSPQAEVKSGASSMPETLQILNKSKADYQILANAINVCMSNYLISFTHKHIHKQTAISET